MKFLLWVQLVAQLLEKHFFHWLWFPHLAFLYYEIWPYYNKTAYENEFYFKNYSTTDCFPSMYSPPLAAYPSIRFFHWSKEWWKYSFVRSSAVFRFTSSIDRLDPGSSYSRLDFWKQEKVKKRFTDNALWIAASFWCKIHLFFHNFTTSLF